MTLTDRRSIRKYSSKEVNDEVLNNLFEKAFRSSNTGNMQVYSVVVTRNEENKKMLAPAHFNQPMITQAPVVLTFNADFNRFKMWCKERNAEPGYDNFLSFLTAAIDAIIAAQTFCVAAEEKGLGICYLGTVIYNADKIIEALKLPKGVVPVATVTLGWPDEAPEQTDRLPIDALVHNETYTEATADSINQWYAEKEALASSEKFIKENNKETLAQIFTDVRYTKANNEHFSTVLLDVLKKQGFMG